MIQNIQYNDVVEVWAKHQEAAKKILKPSCHVCKVCDGRACAGHLTNILEFGGKGNNGGFINSVERLAAIKIHMDCIHEEYDPDPSIDLFGHRFSLPVFASPIGTILTEHPIDSPFFNANAAYATALVDGCCQAGAMAWVGDNKRPGFFEDQIKPIMDRGGIGVPTIKPWTDRSRYWQKLDAAKKAKTMAIATDVDAIGLGYQYAGTSDPPVSTRSLDELKEIVKRAECPFIVKGIMSCGAAVKAAQSGAYGIVISNHGGNIIESSPAPCDMVESIRKAVGDSVKIFVDGGVRSGEDVFKLLALGADAVGIGRPYVQALYGGGAYGVYIYTLKIYWELVLMMRLTNCRSIADITRDKVHIEETAKR